MNRLFNIFIIFIGVISISYGQKEDSIYYYEIADTNAEPIGGYEAIYKWIADNVNMEIMKQGDTIDCRSVQKGRIYIQFVINEQGNLIKAEVAKGLGEPYDSEALRLISKMPINWIPGTKDGQNVKVKTVIPFSFCSDEKDRRRKKKKNKP